MRRLLPIAALLSLALAPAATAKPAGSHIPLPDGWQPEGIASGPGKSLYVGSIPTGAILKLNPKTGKTKTVVEGAEGHAAIGVEAARKHLVAAGGPTGSIFVYDRRTGEELKAFDVDGGFVNDVARARGGYYLTDTRKAVIYRVEGDLRGVSTIDVSDVPLSEGNNLNGIEKVGRSLVAVQSNTGALWKIDPVSGAARQIDLGGAALVNGDGILRLGGRTLLVVQNRDNKIAVVRLSKDLGSGVVKREITSDDFDAPTTIARKGKHIYAVNARFGTTDPQPAPYWVTRVR